MIDDSDRAEIELVAAMGDRTALMQLASQWLQRKRDLDKVILWLRVQIGSQQGSPAADSMPNTHDSH